MAYLLHQLLAESAKRYPHHEAVRFEGAGCTYQELDCLTNQVARSLESVGIQKGDRIGIYLHKSLASVTSIFGILKAGGVYVPLDPNAPVKRLTYIAQNCDIHCVLASQETLPFVSQMVANGAPIRTVVCMDEGLDLSTLRVEGARVISWEAVTRHDTSHILTERTIETDLAYILYTSGSTGDPKGVMISHRTIFTFINWCCETFSISPDDRVTSHAPLHFDLSTFDIFVTLKTGGTVVLVPEKLSIFPIRFVQFLQAERITVTYLVPSILSLMVNYGKLEVNHLPDLRLVLFAGEVFPIKYLRQLVAAIPHAAYYNLYGPTETNVCTYYKVQPQDLDLKQTQPVPIGIACENTEVFVVDDDGQLVTATGVEGELWVRGSCVAQGYWGDPEKTASRFIPNPHQPHYADIAYSTGDIVTLAEDGKNWLFIGRRDHMIKSRGYRIELGEIEAALYNHAGVKEAAVVAIPDDLIGNRITAFVVPAVDERMDEKELFAHLRRTLPPYMVPEHIEMRGELPKTSTGKIHRPMLVGSLSSHENGGNKH